MCSVCCPSCSGLGLPGGCVACGIDTLPAVIRPSSHPVYAEVTRLRKVGQ